MELTSLVLTFGLLAHPNWLPADAIVRWSGHSWSWAGRIVLGIALRSYLAGTVRDDWLHRWDSERHGRYGLALLGFALWPSTKNALQQDNR